MGKGLGDNISYIWMLRMNIQSKNSGALVYNMVKPCPFPEKIKASLFKYSISLHFALGLMFT